MSSHVLDCILHKNEFLRAKLTSELGYSWCLGSHEQKWAVEVDDLERLGEAELE